ncbi:hypothetical protein [Shewanella sp. GD03713]|uniref:hypothetical protein n=1 Tax=Shewanella sp. GD03713 TaxID=2975372 RepID=UPI00244780C4|nr:hypothetical protein [Shewanella sp. GD03713]MDH1472598.1 hypothetical protein [Shewanella sp. GD03713]
MISAKETDLLAQKLITIFLKDVGVNSASDAQKALNKLVAVATQSVEVVVDHNAALDMLDGVRAAAQTRQYITNFGISPSASSIFSIAPTAIQ